MTPVIFHIDVNSAYLSWTAVEQLKNGAGTDLRMIPSIIGGDQKSRHGVVLAKSIPAKRYGIRTGEPVANAFRKCPNLVMEPPDHKMYREKSRMLMDYLRTFTKEIEQVSVDECYVDMTQAMEGFYSPVDAAMLIKNGVREKFGFTVNVGISSNKLLAKMASDFEKPDKVHTLFPEEIRVKMWPLPIGELYMAGHSSVEILKKLEILTIGDLAQADPRLITLHLKSHGQMLWEFANGIDHSSVQSQQAEAKGVGNSCMESLVMAWLYQMAQFMHHDILQAFVRVVGKPRVNSDTPGIHRAAAPPGLHIPEGPVGSVHAHHRLPLACIRFHHFRNPLHLLLREDLLGLIAGLGHHGQL